MSRFVKWTSLIAISAVVVLVATTAFLGSNERWDRAAPPQAESDHSPDIAGAGRPPAGGGAPEPGSPGPVAGGAPVPSPGTPLDRRVNLALDACRADTALEVLAERAGLRLEIAEADRVALAGRPVTLSVEDRTIRAVLDLVAGLASLRWEHGADGSIVVRALPAPAAPRPDSSPPTPDRQGSAERRPPPASSGVPPPIALPDADVAVPLPEGVLRRACGIRLSRDGQRFFVPRIGEEAVPVASDYGLWLQVKDVTDRADREQSPSRASTLHAVVFADADLAWTDVLPALRVLARPGVAVRHLWLAAGEEGGRLRALSLLLPDALPEEPTGQSTPRILCCGLSAGAPEGIAGPAPDVLFSFAHRLWKAGGEKPVHLAIGGTGGARVREVTVALNEARRFGFAVLLDAPDQRSPGGRPPAVGFVLTPPPAAEDAPAVPTRRPGEVLDGDPLLPSMPERAGDAHCALTLTLGVPFPFGRRAGHQNLKRLGAGAETEAAVELGLEWLAAHRSSDGTWGTPRATGLALLAFLGAGQTPTEGKHQALVRDGLTRLAGAPIGAEKEDIAWPVAALSEAAVLTGEDVFRAAVVARMPALLARTEVAGADSPAAMALALARLGGIPADGGAAARSEGSVGETPATTAERLFRRLVLGEDPESPAVRKDAEVLDSGLPAWPGDARAWHFGALAAFQLGGERWTRWNDAMRAVLLAGQIRRGPDRGSWRDGAGDAVERVVETALLTMVFETYYRYGRVSNFR